MILCGAHYGTKRCYLLEQLLPEKKCVNIFYKMSPKKLVINGEIWLPGRCELLVSGRVCVKPFFFWGGGGGGVS